MDLGERAAGRGAQLLCGYHAARRASARDAGVVCPERADEAVLVEGVAQEVRDAGELARFVAKYYTKYQWKMDPSQDPIYAVRPRVAFGMIETGGQFCGSATRWRFGPEQQA